MKDPMIGQKTLLLIEIREITLSIYIIDQNKMEEIPTARKFYDAHYSDDPVVIMHDYAKVCVDAVVKDMLENMKKLEDFETWKEWKNK